MLLCGKKWGGQNLPSAHLFLSPAAKTSSLPSEHSFAIPDFIFLFFLASWSIFALPSLRIRWSDEVRDWCNEVTFSEEQSHYYACTDQSFLTSPEKKKAAGFLCIENWGELFYFFIFTGTNNPQTIKLPCTSFPSLEWKSAHWMQLS